MATKKPIFAKVAWLGVAVVLLTSILNQFVLLANIYYQPVFKNTFFGRDISGLYFDYPFGFFGSIMALTFGVLAKPRYLWGTMVASGLLWVLTPLVAAFDILPDHVSEVVVIGGLYSIPGIVVIIGGLLVWNARRKSIKKEQIIVG